MRRAILRLVVAALLFAGWIGYLAYLAWTSSRPVVLSRPQFLVSTYDVIAYVPPKTPGPVRIKEVQWPREHGKPPKTIDVATDLSQCKGWTGPGDYILPLIKDVGGSYSVAPIPPSPGYNPHHGDTERPIYPLTPETRSQLEEIPKAKGAPP